MPRKIRSNSVVSRIRKSGIRLEIPVRTPSTIATGEKLAKEIKFSLTAIKTGNLKDEMTSLRGRS